MGTAGMCLRSGRRCRVFPFSVTSVLDLGRPGVHQLELALLTLVIALRFAQSILLTAKDQRRRTLARSLDIVSLPMGILLVGWAAAKLAGLI